MSLNPELIHNPELINDLSYWLKVWSSSTQKSHFARRRQDIDTATTWGKLVNTLERISRQDRTKDRIQRTIHFLENNKAPLEGLDVLDVGCGVGDFSLSFMQKGARVTALDPAGVLLQRAEGKARENNYTLNLIKKEWQNVDLTEDCLEKSFDLVFASLNPGVRTPEAIDAMIASSRNYCLLCDIAPGSGRSPSREHLWKEIFNEDMTKTYYNIMLPFHYLYARGYHPVFQSWSERWEETLPLQEVISQAIDYFALYIDLSDKLQKLIRNYFIERSNDNMFSEQFMAKLGMIFWEVSS